MDQSLYLCTKGTCYKDIELFMELHTGLLHDKKQLAFLWPLYFNVLLLAEIEMKVTTYSIFWRSNLLLVTNAWPKHNAIPILWKQLIKIMNLDSRTDERLLFDAEDDVYQMLMKILNSDPSDNMKILKALINAEDDQLPLLDGSTNRRVCSPSTLLHHQCIS